MEKPNKEISTMGRRRGWNGWDIIF